MKRGLIIYLASISSISAAQNCDSISSFQWLLGRWVADQGNHLRLESWTKVSSLTFEGKGELKNKNSNEHKTLESLRLVEMQGELFYLAKVDQNYYPIAFKLTQCTHSSFVFENPSHDFPKKITYQVVNETNLMVNVSDGKNLGFELHFVREQ